MLVLNVFFALVAQFLSAGAQAWKDVLADALLASTGLSKLYERSDASSRALEGLPEVTGWLRGAPEGFLFIGSVINTLNKKKE